MLKNKTAKTVASAFLATAAVFGSAGAASAADQDPTTITHSGPTQAEINYGYWAATNYDKIGG